MHSAKAITDENRGLKIGYTEGNNMPALIAHEGGTIMNRYSFGGQKLGRSFTDAMGQLVSDETYYGSLVMEQKYPSRILFEDGYIDLTPGQQPVFNYHLKDHLGNVRIVLQPGGFTGVAVVQSNDYFPFGMAYSKRSNGWGSNYDVKPYEIHAIAESPTYSKDNRYLYNGKEEQPMPGKWLDYGARFYDAQLGRWHSVDPLAEKAPGWSPYRYGFNNPIKYIDPTGMLEDYYETENKDIVFRNSTEKTLIENGQTLKNIGSEYVEFEGDQLTLNYQTKNSEGDLQAKSFSVPAVSGRPDENGLFDYSDSRQMNIGNGPLPEGKYTINPKEVRNLTLKDDLIGQGLAFTQLFGKKVGAFPGGNAAWGMARLGIDPNTVKVGNVVRGGFTIHGGTSSGSAGCIDLMRTETSFFSKLQQYSQSSSVYLKVDYSKITTPIASPFNSTGTGFYNEW